MIRVFACLVLAAAIAAPAAVAAASPRQAKNRTEQSEHIRRGVQHFERAFYELTPSKQDAEAAREFDFAITAFEAEVAARPSSATAHGYLGRIYSLRKDYKKAAAHYDRLSGIEPLNVDACVLAALAYAEDGQLAESRARLDVAKLRTADPRTLATLAEYASKLDGLKKR